MSKSPKKGPAERRSKQGNQQAPPTPLGTIKADLRYAAAARRMRGLLRLFESRLEAQAANRDVWNFAIEAGLLRSVTGLTEPDLRWLVAERLVVFAVETTRTGETKRSFRRGERLSLTANTVFVLNARAVDVLADCCEMLVSGAPSRHAPPAATSATAIAPEWDSAARELRFAGELVRRIEHAPVLCEVLDAAQRAKWAKYIDNPFNDPSPTRRAKRLSHVLERLNRNQIDRHVHFAVYAKGKQFTWSTLD